MGHPSEIVNLPEDDSKGGPPTSANNYGTPNTDLQMSLSPNRHIRVYADISGRRAGCTEVPVHSCEPDAPWQRGSNENTSGLLPEYLPKGSSPVHDTDYLPDVAAVLNHGPRVDLDDRSPLEYIRIIGEPQLRTPDPEGPLNSTIPYPAP